MRRYLLGLCFVAACTEDPLPIDGGGPIDLGFADAGPADSGVDAGLPDSGDPGDAGVPDSGADAGFYDASLAIDPVWAPCPIGGMDHPRSECTTVEAPLDWDAPEGTKIDLFVKRLRAEAPSGRSMWILMGGPGQAGADGEGIALVIQQRDPGLDMYLLDHRGVGLSTRLFCRQQEAPLSDWGPSISPSEWPACRDAMVARWGEGLRHFSTTGAAKDLAAMIAATTSPGDRPFIAGFSYGTYWAARYLHFAPTQPAGVVLDSVCTPEHCLLSQEDIWENDVAHEIFDVCRDDPSCGDHLGGDPWGALGALFEQPADQLCPVTTSSITNREVLRTLLGNMTFDAGQRRLTPAVVARTARCNDEDRAALSVLYRRYFGANFGASVPLLPMSPFGGQQLSGYSWPLAINILVSELWEPEDPSEDELWDRWDTTYACRGVGRQVGWSQVGWPRYVEPLARIFPRTEVPILAMNAQHDSATPAWQARDVAADLVAPHQRYIEVPGSSHIVTGSGIIVARPGTTCGRDMMVQFLGDPRSEIDTSCLAETLPLGFTVSSTYARYWLGTPDLWGSD
jgi:pimeloyl-ACP methyl ester carboxylesterase